MASGDGDRRIDEAERSFFSELQRLIRPRARALPREVTRICGVDVSYRAREAFAAATLFVDGDLREVGLYRGRFSFPYVSGLLYLHEGPFAAAAVRRLTTTPDLVCFDAHGLAHPRSMGLAVMGGAILRIPSMGVAKSRLVGEEESYRRGMKRLVFGGRDVARVTGTGGRRRYWSPGYSVGMRDVERMILRYGQICLESMAESDRLARSDSWI